jgi:hypothetical protein
MLTSEAQARGCQFVHMPWRLAGSRWFPTCLQEFMSGQSHQDRIQRPRLETGVPTQFVTVSPLLWHLQERIQRCQRLGRHPGLHDEGVYICRFRLSSPRGGSRPPAPLRAESASGRHTQPGMIPIIDVAIRRLDLKHSAGCCTERRCAIAFSKAKYGK